jgi:hypothetical protein
MGGVSLLTNECNQKETLEKLNKISIIGNCAIATAGIFILNVVAERNRHIEPGKKVDHILIYDISKRCCLFWKIWKVILAESINRENTILALQNSIKLLKTAFWGEAAESFAPFFLEKLQEELVDKTSFLSSDEKFEEIRRIALKGNIVFKTCNLFLPESFTDISRRLRENGYFADLVYFSNISEFVQTSNDAMGFTESVKRIVGIGTTFIFSKSTIFGIEQNIYQRIDNSEVPVRDLFSFKFTNPILQGYRPIFDLDQRSQIISIYSAANARLQDSPHEAAEEHAAPSSSPFISKPIENPQPVREAALTWRKPWERKTPAPIPKDSSVHLSPALRDPAEGSPIIAGSASSCDIVARPPQPVPPSAAEMPSTELAPFAAVPANPPQALFTPTNWLTQIRSYHVGVMSLGRSLYRGPLAVSETLLSAASNFLMQVGIWREKTRNFLFRH